MKAIIYKLPERYVIANGETGEIIGYQSSSYRAGQEASNLGSEEYKLCLGLMPLSIMPTQDLEQVLSSGSSGPQSENAQPGAPGRSSRSSGRGRGSDSSTGQSKARARKAKS